MSQMYECESEELQKEMELGLEEGYQKGFKLGLLVGFAKKGSLTLNEALETMGIRREIFDESMKKE